MLREKLRPVWQELTGKYIHNTGLFKNVGALAAVFTEIIFLENKFLIMRVMHLTLEYLLKDM